MWQKLFVDGPLLIHLVINIFLVDLVFKGDQNTFLDFGLEFKFLTKYDHLLAINLQNLVIMVFLL